MAKYADFLINLEDSYVSDLKTIIDKSYTTLKEHGFVRPEDGSSEYVKVDEKTKKTEKLLYGASEVDARNKKAGKNEITYAYQPRYKEHTSDKAKKQIDILYHKIDQTVSDWILYQASQFFLKHFNYFEIPTESDFLDFRSVFTTFLVDLLLKKKLIEDGFFHFLSLRYLTITWTPHGGENKVISLWKKMRMEIDKTMVPHFHYGYGERIHGRDVNINIHYQPDVFSAAYLKNITELSKKHLETMIENQKIVFMTSLTNLDIEITQLSLSKYNVELKTIIDAHIVNYNEMKKSFENSQKAIKSMEGKMKIQDDLIKDLTTKYDRLVKFFESFKEEAPKYMLERLLTDTGSATSAMATSTSAMAISL